MESVSGTIRGTARDSGCTDKGGPRESAGQSAGQRGTAQGSGCTDTSTNGPRESAGQAAGQCGTARDSGCTDKNGAREPHPIWGFKYCIKAFGANGVILSSLLRCPCGDAATTSCVCVGVSRRVRVSVNAKARGRTRWWGCAHACVCACLCVFACAGAILAIQIVPSPRMRSKLAQTSLRTRSSLTQTGPSLSKVSRHTWKCTRDNSRDSAGQRMY